MRMTIRGRGIKENTLICETEDCRMIEVLFNEEQKRAIVCEPGMPFQAELASPIYRVENVRSL